MDQRTEVREFRLALENYTVPLQQFNFLTYLRNSVFVTVVATFITLAINSMAAFALSKYRFRGRNAIFLVILGTLMIPLSVILVPVYLVISEIGWVNNLWGVIIPGAATPTGVFLLRQYMLTIPDELIDAARIDGGMRIFWQVVVPFSARRWRCWRSSRSCGAGTTSCGHCRADPQRALHPAGRPERLQG